jgi:hypothetical protein
MIAPPIFVPPPEDVPPPDVPDVPAEDAPPELVALPPWLVDPEAPEAPAAPEAPEAPETPDDPEAPAEFIPPPAFVLPPGAEAPPVPAPVPSLSELHAEAVATNTAIVTRQNIPCTLRWGVAIRRITTRWTLAASVKFFRKAPVLQRLERSVLPGIQGAKLWRFGCAQMDNAR